MDVLSMTDRLLMMQFLTNVLIVSFGSVYLLFFGILFMIFARDRTLQNLLFGSIIGALVGSFYQCMGYFLVAYWILVFTVVSFTTPWEHYVPTDYSIMGLLTMYTKRAAYFTWENPLPTFFMFTVMLLGGNFFINPYTSIHFLSALHVVMIEVMDVLQLCVDILLILVPQPLKPWFIDFDTPLHTFYLARIASASLASIFSICHAYMILKTIHYTVGFFIGLRLNAKKLHQK